MQYLTGIAGFRRLELSVGPGVLIPRPETETTVEYALNRLPEGGTLVDIGTGSGAIALAVADERPEARVYGTESSQDALDWAEKNREKLSSSAVMLLGDLFEALPTDLRGQLDVIVSNPPYIADRERSVLPKDVIEHEPHVALFAGPDGSYLIEQILRDAPAWLKPGGWLLLEISPHLQTLVPRLFRDAGYLEVSIYEDLAGRPRVVEGRTS